MLTDDVAVHLPIFVKSLMEDKDEPILQHEGNRLAICYLMTTRRTEESWVIANVFPSGNPTFTLIPNRNGFGKVFLVKTDLTIAEFFCEATRIINNHMGKLLNAS